MAQAGHDARARETRIAGAAAGLGIAALALPAAVEALTGSGGPPLCPFRLATGLPCPFCGGTRALAAAARGDLDGALRHNAVWPVVAVLLVAAGAAGLVAAHRGRAPLTAALRSLGSATARRPRVGVAVVLVALAVPWAVALANRDAITTDATARVPTPAGGCQVFVDRGGRCASSESCAPAPPSESRAEIRSVHGRLAPPAPPSGGSVAAP